MYMLLKSKKLNAPFFEIVKISRVLDDRTFLMPPYFEYTLLHENFTVVLGKIAFRSFNFAALRISVL